MYLNRAAIEELPPELIGGSTFHLPLELSALHLAGADQESIDARVEDRLNEAFAEGLVDPPFYRWAVAQYRPTAEVLLSGNSAEVSGVLRSIAALGDGLAGAAFHGLIRLGYGIWRKDIDEVARGLAYVRTRRQVLASELPVLTTDPLVGSVPAVSERKGHTVFDLLNVASGGAPAEEPDPRDLTIGRLVAGAVALAERTPSSFVSIHTVTGLHGLCEFHHLVEGRAARDEPLTGTSLERWWRGYATALQSAMVLDEGIGREALPASTKTGDLDQLIEESVETGKAHDVKLLVALRRMLELGCADETQVRGLALRKLAATECVDC